MYSGETIGSAGWDCGPEQCGRARTGIRHTSGPPADGLQALDLTGGNEGIIHQDVSVTPGQDYRLSFYMSGNLAYDPQVKSLAVYADGTMLGQLDFDSAGAGLRQHELAVSCFYLHRAGLVVASRVPQSHAG